MEVDDVPLASPEVTDAPSQDNVTMDSSELRPDSEDDEDSDDDINVQIGTTDLKIASKEKDGDESEEDTNDNEGQRGVDLNTKGNIDGKPVIDIELETLSEKPWRHKGANLSEYFNYGFVEETWKIYQQEVKTGKKIAPPPIISSSIGPPPVISAHSPGRAPPMMMPPRMIPPRMPPGMMPPGLPVMPPGMPPGMPPMLPGMMPPGMFAAPPPTPSAISVKTEH